MKRDSEIKRENAGYSLSLLQGGQHWSQFQDEVSALWVKEMREGQEWQKGRVPERFIENESQNLTWKY